MEAQKTIIILLFLIFFGQSGSFLSCLDFTKKMIKDFTLLRTSLVSLTLLKCAYPTRLKISKPWKISAKERIKFYGIFTAFTAAVLSHELLKLFLEVFFSFSFFSFWPNFMNEIKSSGLYNKHVMLVKVCFTFQYTL